MAFRLYQQSEQSGRQDQFSRTTTVCWYLTSGDPPLLDVTRWIQLHWQIETVHHDARDVLLREDAHRAKLSAHRWTALRYAALHVLWSRTSDSLKEELLRSSWSSDDLKGHPLWRGIQKNPTSKTNGHLQKY